MPRAKLDKIERLDELYRFLQQTNLSKKNLNRLKTLCVHEDAGVVEFAASILDIARAHPGKRRRWRTLFRRHRLPFERAVKVLGLKYFEVQLDDHADFESPLWSILAQFRKPDLPLDLEEANMADPSDDSDFDWDEYPFDR